MALSFAQQRLLNEAPVVQPRSEFVRTPEGGLILTGKPLPAQSPGFFAGLSRFIPERFRRTEPAPAPYWIPQPVAATPAPAPVVVPTLPGYSDWGEIERETEREARIVRELGDFSKRVLADERLVGKER